MLLNELFHSFPKVELHAHLNGCIRESTLQELAEERNITLSPLLHDLRHHHRTDVTEDDPSTTASNLKKINKKQRSLQECFQIFGEISKCVTDLNALKRITDEALEDFASQNVAYLELRSTPKILYRNISHEQKATKKDYVDTILQAFKDFEDNHDNLGMIPRYIVSINRAEPTTFAMEHAKLAIEYKTVGSKYVVGLDLSGNPLKNDFNDLQPAFDLVRNAGLKSSIHFGEIPCDESNDEDFATKDTNAILSYQPDRLGHSLLLTDEMFATLDKKKIPVECCPTSNVMTLELAKHVEGDLVHGLRRHPRLKHWIESKYPISINTDDPGVFDTDSTKEFILLAEAFDIQDPQIIVNIVENSVDQIFESKDFKQQLRKSISERMQVLITKFNESQLN